MRNTRRLLYHIDFGSKKFKTQRLKNIVIVSAIILLVVLLGMFFFPSLIGQYGLVFQNERRYSVGQEIAGFPTMNVSIIFTSWTYTKSFCPRGVNYPYTPRENATFVAFNFTLRNIASTEIEIRSNLQYGTGADLLTPRIAPYLRYGAYYAEPRTDFPARHYWGLWEYKYSLLPNQSVKGYLLYEILEGYTAIELVYPNKEKPEIIIILG